MRGLRQNAWMGLLILILALNLMLSGCGDATSTSLITSVPIGTPTAPAIATATQFSTTVAPTATAIATTIAPTAIPTATTIAATPTVAKTTVAIATATAEATIGPDEVPTPPPTIALPKLDAKAEGLLLYDYQGDLWALLLSEGVRTNLTKSSTNNKVLINRNPVWSPDSLRIAFASVRDIYNPAGYKGSYDIYVMRLDGSNLTRLTKDADSLEVERTPIAWLSTGEILVKQVVRGGNPTAGQVPPLVLLNPDTGVITALPLTDPNYEGGAVAVSPDKSQIAYVVRKPTNNLQETKADVYLTSFNKGGTPVALTNFAAAPNSDIAALAWSPDGQNITLAQTYSAGCGGLNFYSVGKGGGTPRELFKGKGLLAGLSYAANGKWLAYSSGGECADGSFKLRLLDAEKGGTPLELIEGFNPSYGKKIVG